MRDTLIKSKATLIGIALITYVVRLFMQQHTVAANGDPAMSTVLLILCAGVGVYLIAIVFFQKLLPNNRRSLAVAWIAIIIISHLYLQDTPENYVFLGDVMKLLGVYLIIVGPMKLLVSKRTQLAREEKSVEIIEV